MAASAPRERTAPRRPARDTGGGAGALDAGELLGGMSDDEAAAAAAASTRRQRCAVTGSRALAKPCAMTLFMSENEGAGRCSRRWHARRAWSLLSTTTASDACARAARGVTAAAGAQWRADAHLQHARHGQHGVVVLHDHFAGFVWPHGRIHNVRSGKVVAQALGEESACGESSRYFLVAACNGKRCTYPARTPCRPPRSAAAAAR